MFVCLCSVFPRVLCAARRGRDDGQRAVRLRHRPVHHPPQHGPVPGEGDGGGGGADVPAAVGPGQRGRGGLHEVLHPPDADGGEPLREGRGPDEDRGGGGRGSP